MRDDTMGDYFRAMKPIRKQEAAQEKRERKKGNLDILEKWGIAPRWPSPTHAIIEAFGHGWNFWPTTGKWQRREKGAPVRRGVEQLIADIETERSQTL